MQWICNIALFLMLSGILLEVAADTKYYKFARWVSGVLLLLQFLQPVTDMESVQSKFITMFSSFDYALGTEKVVEEIYRVEEQTENTVLASYTKTIEEQVAEKLENNGLVLLQMDILVAEDGAVEQMDVWAEYKDGKETQDILVPTVVPVRIGEEKKQTVSPLELYIRELLAEFYRMEENKIRVIIQEAG